MSGWSRLLRSAALVALAVATYFVVPVSGDLDRGVVTRIALTLVAVGLLSAAIVWQFARESESGRVDGLLLVLVVAVLVFALVFYRLEVADPGQMVGLRTRLDALYFTMTTMLTIGYGDVHAEGQAARALAIVLMVFDVAVLATAAATVSSRLRARVRHHGPDRPDHDAT